MSGIILIVFGLACFIFAGPFGESAAKLQSGLLGVNFNIKIFIWSYRIVGLVIFILGIFNLMA